MDFSLDDPLADLVSDNSNDSFFETSKKPPQTGLKAKDGTKQQSTESQRGFTSAKTMEDLFGIQSSIHSTKPQGEIKSTPPSSLSIKKPIISRTEPSKSGDIFVEGDIIADLGFDPKKPKGSKSSILDDLLTSIDTSKTTQPALKYSRPLTAAGVNAPKNISRQSTETDNSGPGTSQGTSLPTTRPKTSVGRRQSVNSGNDPLGLFTTPPAGSVKDQSFESKVDSNKEISFKSKVKSLNPDWLGLDLQSSIKKPESKISTSEPQILQVNQTELPEAISSVSYSQQEFSQMNANPTYNNQNTIAIVAANMETQNAIQALHQQESQILMAAQLKNQERALLEMQKKQQELLNQQELKFNELLKNQISRQNNLETTIKAQQERINAHIQMLMTQPPLLSDTAEMKIFQNNENKKTDLIAENENHENQIQFEHEVKRLELEKLRLEDLISNININYEKELELIENSHKKQIQLLEDNLEIVEKRLQTEIISLQEFYSKKLNDIEVEKQKLVNEYEEKLRNLKENYEKNIADLKLDYENSIENLKSDHKSTIEAIRESKLMEFAVVQDNTSYLQILRNASTNLENVSGNLQNLRDEMYNKIDLEYKEREDKLMQKEKKLNDLERRLKITEESSDKEKSRLIELVTTLEIQLQKLSQDSADEKWNIKQKLSALEIEREAFEREKLYIREQLTRSEKKLEDLKEYQVEEYRKLLEKVQDEKKLLAIEKTKFETARKLDEGSGLNRSRAEIDIAIKVAKEATKQADVERERFLKSQRELEIRKRDLIDQENELRSKGEELESEILKTKSKERKVREALQRQKYIEQSLTAKVQFLQNQTRVLSERETQLSQERLLLSKERIDLQELKKKVELSKCSLCKIGERSIEISNIITGNDILPDAENYLTEFNFAYNNNFTHNIDQLFDKDVTESLMKMEHINKNFNNELNTDDDNVLNQNLNTQNFDLPQPQGFLDPEFSTIDLNSRLSKIDEF
ncbi:putative leucine-rich repeat-containing protein DDB_G0290503 [Condylostylus longicornis]|uniref:putative leucine-rich repeat-containing protein DDB_G0290503 n=1 Tax=Condylostylus longicornis TaxID=2530218 RepID=UPI00244DA85B|nr:putative leucine-rich repeat-containing protein DDB_G0290503 [Condylostylus longicornis]